MDSCSLSASSLPRYYTVTTRNESALGSKTVRELLRVRQIPRKYRTCPLAPTISHVGCTRLLFLSFLFSLSFVNPLLFFHSLFLSSPYTRHTHTRSLFVFTCALSLSRARARTRRSSSPNIYIYTHTPRTYTNYIYDFLSPYNAHEYAYTGMHAHARDVLIFLST